MNTEIVDSVDGAEFARACDHRRALLLELDGVDWDERDSEWRTRYARYYRRLFAGGSAAFVTYHEGNAVVGTCVVSLVDEYRRATFSTPTGYINGMYVLPEFRNHGVGAALLGAAMNWCRNRNCIRIRLHPAARAVDFYRRAGFHPIAEFEFTLPTREAQFFKGF